MEVGQFVAATPGQLPLFCRFCSSEKENKDAEAGPYCFLQIYPVYLFKNNMDIMHEETFGPVLPVTTFNTLDEAIAMANDSIFGLTSSVYTESLNDAFYITRRLQFGETYINRENFEAMQGFHAGWKQSGIGGADGKHGLEEYLLTQMVYLQTKR